MADENAKREAMMKKLQEERERLSQLHLITSSSELKQDLHAIDEEMISTSKKQQNLTSKNTSRSEKKSFR